MALIKSISGIRGTIGGSAGDNLTPQDIVDCTAGFGTWLLQNNASPKVVIGRDARISGPIVNGLVVNTLLAMGIDVVDLGLSTTPTVEMAVPAEEAGAGIIITASHNPRHWNALKFLNHKGEFISAEDGRQLLEYITKGQLQFASVDELGVYTLKEGYLDRHIEQILAMPLVHLEAIKAQGFKVVVDGVNSSGSIAVPRLLEQLGCSVITINETPSGDFAHNPEPLPKNLTQLSETVVKEGADLGIAVDPDVDRLAFVCENGEMFGEEYTLVAVADYVLSQKPGNTVSNLSSTRALRDVTRKAGGTYYASAVGEVNVVNKMKEMEAVIGGEGNGGVIVPELHYGRDALAGIALFLSHLVSFGGKISELKQTYPEYHMVKDKIPLDPNLDLEALLKQLEERYKEEDYNTIDGLKIDFEEGWVHLRKSNTEPIIRVYAEGASTAQAEALVANMKASVNAIVG